MGREEVKASGVCVCVCAVLSQAVAWTTQLPVTVTDVQTKTAELIDGVHTIGPLEKKKTITVKCVFINIF